MSISVGSYRNRQDINEKLRVYKQTLDLQSQLAQRQEEANRQAYKLQGQPIPATELPKYASYEEELADRSGQLQQMMMTLQKIFKYPKDAKISLDKFTEAGYTPADFNRYAGEFMDILKNTKGLTPQFFMTNWDRFWTRAQSRDDGLIDIGVYDDKQQGTYKVSMDRFLRENLFLGGIDPVEKQRILKLVERASNNAEWKANATILLDQYNDPSNTEEEKGDIAGQLIDDIAQQEEKEAEAKRQLLERIRELEKLQEEEKKAEERIQEEREKVKRILDARERERRIIAIEKKFRKEQELARAQKEALEELKGLFEEEYPEDIAELQPKLEMEQEVKGDIGEFLNIMDTMERYKKGKKRGQFKPFRFQLGTEALYPYMKMFSAEELPERYNQNTTLKKIDLWQTLINEYNRIQQEQQQLREQQEIPIEMGQQMPILRRPSVKEEKEEKEVEPLTIQEIKVYNQLENALANERNWDDTGAYTGSKGKITAWLNLLGYERTKFENDTFNVGQRQALRNAFEEFTKQQEALSRRGRSGQGLYFNIPKTTRQYIHKQSSGGVIQPIHHKTTRHFIIGRGIELEPQERFVKFGSYLIHKPMLYNQNRLSLKFPSKVGIKEFPSQILSNELADLLKFILENQKIDIKLFNDLNKKDRDLFHHLITRARLDQQLGMMGYKDEETEKDFKRFELLRGEVLAGNNNYDLLKELRQLILNFMATNKMRKSEGNQILYEINSILVH